jgi:hypothetical protein
MNCAEFHSLIHDLARHDASADAALTDALAHAESCPVCDHLLREAERVTIGLRSLAAQHQFDAASPRTETALLDAFRQQHAPTPRLHRAGGWLVVSTVGLAAAALFAILLTGYRAASSPDSPAAPAAAPRQSNPPSASPRPTWADYALEGETEEQAAAAYIPLAADFDPAWLEGGVIVRVVLSRPALESFGVPVIAGADGQMIADMVVSYDGTPQAIRVVDWQVAGIP